MTFSINIGGLPAIILDETQFHALEDAMNAHANHGFRDGWTTTAEGIRIVECADVPPRLIEETHSELGEILRAVADYMWSEGCSCCRNIEEHEQNKAVLAKLLKVPKYDDGSGYDFSPFRTERASSSTQGSGKHE